MFTRSFSKEILQLIFISSRYQFYSGRNLPESIEHNKIKSIISEKLKEWFGHSIQEYSESGHRLDVFSVTLKGVSINVEIIWSTSKAQFFYDLNLIQQSDAQIKIVIANPKILQNQVYVREFGKIVASQRQIGVKMHGTLINGQNVISDKDFLDKHLKKLIYSMVNQVVCAERARDASLEKPPTVTIRTANRFFKNYAMRIVSDYNNFSSFEREGVNPIIEQFSKFDLKKYFVEIFVQNLLNRRVEYPKNLIGNWLNEDSMNGLFLIGDFGTGKSTLCAFLAYELAHDFLQNSRTRIPLFVPLRYLDGISKEHLLSVLQKALNIDWETFSYLSKSGRLLLILDGFDEMTTRTNWKKIKSDFQEIINLLCKGKSKVIVTCRTHFFKKDSMIFGEDTELMESLRATENFMIVTMFPFTYQQIFDFISRRVKNPKEIMDQIDRTYNLEDLCRRPLLIDMVVSTLPKLVSLRSTINVANLYETYTEEWIKREDWRAQLKPEHKAELMESLAFDLFSKDRNTISFYELKKMIETKFGAKNESEAAACIDYDVRTCSFLHRDRWGNYSFMHRSFLEFFVAKKIAREINFQRFKDLGTKPLNPEIVFFSSLMINPLAKETLFEAIYYTKGKEPSQCSSLAGNAFRLLIELGVTNFESKDFSGCYIEDVDFSSCLFECCNFRNSKLSHLSFLGTRFLDCQFDNNYFENCRFRHNTIMRSSFRKSKFRNTELMNLVFSDNCEMSLSEFWECIFHWTTFDGLNIEGMIFEDCKAGLRHSTLNGIGFVSSNLRHAKFHNSDLLLSLFFKSTFTKGEFIDCDLGGSCFYKCALEFNFKGGSVSFSSIMKSKFDNSKFVETRFFNTFMNEKNMGDMALENVKIKRIDAAYHKITRGDQIRTKDNATLSAYSILNNVVETNSLGEDFEERTIKQFHTSKDLFKGYEPNSAMGTCFYAISKQSRRPRTLGEIAGFFNVNKIILSRLYRKMLLSGHVKRVIVKSKTWVDIFARDMGVSKRTIVLAKSILDFLDEKRLILGRRQTTKAAAAIYLACKKNSERISIRNIAKTANLSSTSISSVQKEIAQILASKYQ
jgi:transcription initiation factor TFIIIB Brf1 subunit/transcription initiation factor TFIIB/DNA replication protein DnaC